MVEIDKKDKGGDKDNDDNDDQDLEGHENDDKANESMAEVMINNFIRAKNEDPNNISMIEDEDDGLLSGDETPKDENLFGSFKKKMNAFSQPGGKRFANVIAND
jgi:hypothetical protein